LAGLAPLDSGVTSELGTAPAVDPQQLKTACARLTTLLQNDDAAAATYWDDNAALFQAAFAQHSHRIAEHLHNFDLDTALIELQKTQRAHHEHP
jgi:hypothetical protein